MVAVAALVVLVLLDGLEGLGGVYDVVLDRVNVHGARETDSLLEVSDVEDDVALIWLGRFAWPCSLCLSSVALTVTYLQLSHWHSSARVIRPRAHHPSSFIFVRADLIIPH